MADAQPESMKNRKLSLKKMEALVREMMDSETGVPLRRHKLLLTAVPDAMAGYDMIEWLMEHYNLDDSSEAISLALQLCLHCFIYPVSESRDISVKDDSSIYKFHPETAWPSRGHEPDSRSYAVYLVKKQMRKDKPRLHAIDEWESEEHARLKMNLSAHWSGITVLAEEQLKLEKNRKKTEKLIAESQERAYWMVYRPPPGAPNRLEVPPYVQLRQPDRFSQRKYEAELEFLKNHVARSRTKVSQAAQSLVTYTTTYAEFDPVMTPPIPSNPWITDDATFWNLNSDYVEIPTERRVKRWAISSCDVLKDPTGRREFEKYLQTEYSHENIRFWMACNRLKNCTPTSLIGMRAKEIFDEFLAHGAPCEVNIDSKTLDWTVNMLKSHTNPPRIIFNKAQMHVFHLLTKDCYPRFVRSEYYKNLLAAAQQAGQRRRMFGFGPSSKKKTSGVDGGGSSSSSGGPGGSSGGGVGGSLSAGGSSGAGAAAAAAAGTSSSAVTSSAASAGLSRNSSDKTLKGSAVAASSSAAGIGCIASIIEQDRRLSHSHSTSDLRKIDASASLGPAQTEVCPWDTHDGDGHSTATPATTGAVYSASCIEMQHLASGSASLPKSAQSPCQALSRINTPAKGSPGKDPYAGGGQGCDVCPWDSSGSPVPTVGSPAPRSLDDKRKDYVTNARQIKSCDVGSRLAPPAPKKPQRNSVAAIETHLGDLNATRTPSIEETEDSVGGRRSHRDSSIPESVAEINEEDEIAENSELQPSSSSNVKFRVESDTDESVTPTSAIDRAAGTSAAAPVTIVTAAPPSAAHPATPLLQFDSVVPRIFAADTADGSDTCCGVAQDNNAIVFDEADVNTQYACHIASGVVHAQSGYSGQPEGYSRLQNDGCLISAENLPDEFVLEPNSGGFLQFVAPYLDRIPEETGSETSSITTEAREILRSSDGHSRRNLTGIVPGQAGAMTCRATGQPRPGDSSSYLNQDPVPTHIMSTDPLPSVPLPHRSGFLGTYSAPMPQPDNTLMVLRKAKEALEKKLLEEHQRLQREAEKAKNSTEEIQAADNSSAASSRTCTSWGTATDAFSSAGRCADAEVSTSDDGGSSARQQPFQLQQRHQLRVAQDSESTASSNNGDAARVVSAIVHTEQHHCGTVGTTTGFDMEDPTSIQSLLSTQHPKQDFELYQQAKLHAIPPIPPAQESPLHSTAASTLDTTKALSGAFAPCSSQNALDNSTERTVEETTLSQVLLQTTDPTSVTESPQTAVQDTPKRLRFAETEKTSSSADNRSRLRAEAPPPLTLQCVPVAIDGDDEIKFIDDSSSEEVGTPVPMADKLEEIKAEFLRRAADPNIRRVLPTDPTLRHIAESLLPTHLRRVTIVESVSPSVANKVISDIVTPGSVASSSDLERVRRDTPSSMSSTCTDSASQETLVDRDPNNATLSASGTLDPLNISIDDIKPMDDTDFLLSSLLGDEEFVGVPPLPDELSEPDLNVSDIVSVPPPPPRYSESDLELNKTLSKYGGLPSYPLPVSDTPTSKDAPESLSSTSVETVKRDEEKMEIPLSKDDGTEVEKQEPGSPKGDRTVLGSLPVFGSPLNVGTVSSVVESHDATPRDKKDVFGSSEAFSEPFLSTDGIKSSTPSSSRKRSGRSSSQKDRDRHRSSSRRKRESCRTETVNTPVKPADICPWENEELCKMECSTFVKTYATFGYL